MAEDNSSPGSAKTGVVKYFEILLVKVSIERRNAVI